MSLPSKRAGWTRGATDADRKVEHEESGVHRGTGAALDESSGAELQAELKLLHLRADQLAKRRHRVQEEHTRPFLVIRLGEERYGLELVSVEAVVPCEGLRALPETPAEVVGVFIHRGSPCTVVDLGTLLCLPLPDDRPRRHVAVLRHAHDPIGLLVDRAESTTLVRDAECVEVAPSSPDQEGFTRGLTRDGVVLLDALSLFRHPLFVDDEGCSGVSR